VGSFIGVGGGVSDSGVSPEIAETWEAATSSAAGEKPVNKFNAALRMPRDDLGSSKNKGDMSITGEPEPVARVAFKLPSFVKFCNGKFCNVGILQRKILQRGNYCNVETLQQSSAEANFRLAEIPFTAFPLCGCGFPAPWNFATLALLQRGNYCNVETLQQLRIQ